MLDPSDPLALAGLAVAGVFAGAVNTVAGGGSFIGLAALIFFGLPANVANATNRVGVVIQSATASWQFKREGLLDARGALPLVIPACLGALVGSWLSVDIDEALFRKVIGAVMWIMLPVIALRPKRWLEGREGATSRLQAPGMFLIGAYGGFLQAGVGIFILAALVLLTGRDLVRANAVKVLMVATFTLPPLAVFVWSGLIEWVPGLAMAAGSAVGGWLGTKLTVSWGPRFVRAVLLVVILVSGGRLLLG